MALRLSLFYKPHRGNVCFQTNHHYSYITPRTQPFIAAILTVTERHLKCCLPALCRSGNVRALSQFFTQSLFQVRFESLFSSHVVTQRFEEVEFPGSHSVSGFHGPGTCCVGFPVLMVMNLSRMPPQFHSLRHWPRYLSFHSVLQAGESSFSGHLLTHNQAAFLPPSCQIQLDF